MTYTYAILKVSPACFEEVCAKMAEAGYEDRFHSDAHPDELVIDMHGIALEAE